MIGSDPEQMTKTQHRLLVNHAVRLLKEVVMCEKEAQVDLQSNIFDALFAPVVLLLFLLAPATVYGQSTTYARVVGTVKDQTGAVLPGVEVTVAARATNVPSLALTTDRGDYLIDKLIPGQYDVKAELPGFKTQLSLGIRLVVAQVAQVARVDLTMTPGEISE